MMDFIAANADTILAAVNTILAVSLVPTLWSQWRARRSTTPLSTSVLTGAGLAVISVTFLSMSLWYAATVLAVASTMWAVIATQRIIYGAGGKS